MAGSVLSRRQLAIYGADQIIAGNVTDLMPQLAAYLVESGRKKDYQRLVSDIEAELAERGIVVAKVVSARPLSKNTLDRIEQFIINKTNANKVELVASIDGSLMGGAVISTANYRLDASLKNRINKLKGISKE